MPNKPTQTAWVPSFHSYCCAFVSVSLVFCHLMQFILFYLFASKFWTWFRKPVKIVLFCPLMSWQFQRNVLP